MRYLFLLLLLAGCQTVEVDEHKHFMVLIDSSTVSSLQVNVWYECLESSTTRWYKVWESTHAINGDFDVPADSGAVLP